MLPKTIDGSLVVFAQSFDYFRLRWCWSAAVIPVDLTLSVFWVADTNVDIPRITSHRIEISWNEDSMKTRLRTDLNHQFLGGFTIFTSRIKLGASDSKRILQHSGFHKTWLFHLSAALQGVSLIVFWTSEQVLNVWLQLGRKEGWVLCTEPLSAHRARERRASVTKHIVTMLHMARAAHCTLGNCMLLLLLFGILKNKIQQMLVMTSMDWILFNKDILFDIEN